MLRFENVGMRYGVGPEILRDVNFALDPGSFHFLTGPSGAGKTTLLKLMYLALRPTRGLVHLLGRDVSLTPRSELPDLRRQIGVVFQEFRLIDHLSAVENVAMPLVFSGVPSPIRLRTARMLLDRVGLGQRLEHRPTQLSGGEQQRVAIARALVGSPVLLLADEPTGNLDTVTGASILALLRELNEERQLTLLVATHDPDVARFAQRVVRIRDGRSLA